jgi:hypothetical protein
VTASASPDSAGTGCVFHDDEAGYSFEYEREWRVVPLATNSQNVVVYPPPLPGGRRAAANVSVSVIPVPQGTDLMSFNRQDIAFLEAIRAFQLLKTEQTTFADSPAFAITYTGSAYGRAFKALQVTTVIGSTAYSAIFSTTPQTFGRYLGGARLIVRTFKPR